jgi:hypothetical protein
VSPLYCIFLAVEPRGLYLCPVTLQLQIISYFDIYLHITKFTGTKPGASKCMSWCSKFTKTHLRVPAIPKIFPGVIPPDPRSKGKEGGEGGKGKEGRGRQERGGEREGGEGKEREGGILGKGQSPPRDIVLATGLSPATAEIRRARKCSSESLTRYLLD